MFISSCCVNIVFYSTCFFFLIQIKQPKRAYGDWAEFLSSGGKIYYYNYKSEKTQWEKPSEWDWLVAQEYKPEHLFSFFFVQVQLF